MDDLKPLAVFAEVVDAGSMSGAARRLGMSPSAVSQTIRALEQHGGVTLLHRSTRKLALTEAGERYYPHCQRMLEAARAAAQSLQQAHEAPTGELRVSAPVGFANHLAPALAPLLAEAPQLRLRLLVDDAMIDLIDARIDVAIRIGRLADSSWVARKLCDFDTILCASPDYLARAGVPAAPQQLPAHQWLAFGRELSAAEPLDGALLAASTTNLGKGGIATSQAVTRLLDARSADGEHHRVQVQARIASNNQVSLQQMCEHGLGIAHLAYADAAPALARGALVHLLPQWRFGTMPVWAVTPRRDEAEAAKVRGAVDCLKRYFANAANVGVGISRDRVMGGPLQGLLLLAAGAGVLPFLVGLVRLRRPVAGTSPWPPAASILACALAFNLTFFWQELWLVLPKALVPGLSPVLYHNDHDWTGSAPIAQLLQGTGALATLCSGLASFAALRAGRGLSAGARLFLFWLAFQGLFQSLAQWAVGNLLPGNDVGRALAYLGANGMAKAVLCAASIAAMAAAGRALAAQAPAGLADSRASGSRAFASALLATGTGCVVLSVPFREPRELVEVVLVPALVCLLGIGWLVFGSTLGRVGEQPGTRIGSMRLLLALAVLLALFQGVLRTGVRF